MLRSAYEIQSQTRYAENRAARQSRTQGIQWTANFEVEFPAIAPNFGFSNDEIKDILDNSRTLRFVIQNGQKAQGTAMSGSVVRVDWTKGKFDGVLVEGQRGDETAWTQPERDFRSPYTDERAPLAAGKPEERRYRLRYLIDDKPVGSRSDVIVIITKP